jgi:uncharacterized protein YgbK (DUF1537 family)
MRPTACRWGRCRLALSRPGATRTPRPYNDGVHYGIIADDLTGACDVAASLTRLGYRPIVQLRAVRLGLRRVPKAPDCAVMVINARSRESSVDGAVALVDAAGDLLQRAGRQIDYYKMDSTLRGHWPEELNALYSRLRPKRVLICPAFPARGRLFRDGHLHVPREQWSDVYESSSAGFPAGLQTRLREVRGESPQLVGLQAVRSGPAFVRATVDAARRRFLVFDAVCERHLETIGKALRGSAERYLWAGSAGLAPHVFPRLAQPEVGPAPSPERPWLLIQGSRQRISHEQFRQLGDSVLSVAFHSRAGRKQLGQWYDAAVEALARRQHVSVEVGRDWGASFGEEFARFLERLLDGVCAKQWLGGIFVSGGSTAEVVCDRLRVNYLRVVAEVRPGIAWSFLVDGRLPDLPLITKAGGFGSAGEVREILKEVSS